MHGDVRCVGRPSSSCGMGTAPRAPLVLIGSFLCPLHVRHIAGAAAGCLFVRYTLITFVVFISFSMPSPFLAARAGAEHFYETHAAEFCATITKYNNCLVMFRPHARTITTSESMKTIRSREHACAESIHTIHSAIGWQSSSLFALVITSLLTEAAPQAPRALWAVVCVIVDTHSFYT